MFWVCKIFFKQCKHCCWFEVWLKTQEGVLTTLGQPLDPLPLIFGRQRATVLVSQMQIMLPSTLQMITWCVFLPFPQHISQQLQEDSFGLWRTCPDFHWSCAVYSTWNHCIALDQRMFWPIINIKLHIINIGFEKPTTLTSCHMENLEEPLYFSQMILCLTFAFTIKVKLVGFPFRHQFTFSFWCYCTVFGSLNVI